MPRPSKYSPELRERAVRMVFESVPVGRDAIDRRETRLHDRGT